MDDFLTAFEACLSGVLDAGGSFNMYMFHGGTNFGFMAGANYFEGSHYKPDVTSYGTYDNIGQFFRSLFFFLGQYYHVNLLLFQIMTRHCRKQGTSLQSI